MFRDRFDSKQLRAVACCTSVIFLLIPCIEASAFTHPMQDALAEISPNGGCKAMLPHDPRLNAPTSITWSGPCERRKFINSRGTLTVIYMDNAMGTGNPTPLTYQWSGEFRNGRLEGRVSQKVWKDDPADPMPFYNLFESDYVNGYQSGYVTITQVEQNGHTVTTGHPAYPLSPEAQSDFAALSQTASKSASATPAVGGAQQSSLGIKHKPQLSSGPGTKKGQDATRCVTGDGANGIHNACGSTISVVWCVQGDYSDCNRGLDMESDVKAGQTIAALPLKSPGTTATVHYSACVGSNTAVAEGWHVKCSPPE